MKTALVLHCWFGKPTDNWYPWLKEELTKKGYQVEIPAIPTMDTNAPDLAKQLEFIKNGKFVEAETLVIGHSLGALLALRLAEKYKLGQVILVSGWDFDDLTAEHKSFWDNPYNHQLIKNNVGKITVIHSDNDPYVTAFQAEEMAKRLGAKFILKKGAGHMTSKDGVTTLPEALQEIT